MDTTTSPKMKVLFLCTGNSCRSQMAQGWARHLKSDVMEACSAGTDPRGLDPYAVQVMAEAGVDISGQRSKSVRSLMTVPFDYVVTVCGQAQEQCPVYPGRTKVIHQGFEDPPALAKGETDPEKILGQYRRVRDEIRAYVETMPESLKGSR